MHNVDRKVTGHDPGEMMRLRGWTKHDCCLSSASDGLTSPPRSCSARNSHLVPAPDPIALCNAEAFCDQAGHVKTFDV